jgi:hypothetical protein
MEHSKNPLGANAKGSPGSKQKAGYLLMAAGMPLLLLFPWVGVPLLVWGIVLVVTNIRLN